MNKYQAVPPLDPNDPAFRVSTLMLALDKLEVGGDGLLVPRAMWAGRRTAPGSYIPAWFNKQRPWKRFSIRILPDKSGWTVHRMPDVEIKPKPTPKPKPKLKPEPGPFRV